jgi:hypothetical protein
MRLAIFAEVPSPLISDVPDIMTPLQARHLSLRSIPVASTYQAKASEGLR